jgi:Mrp family chromosome partitioning ATPase
MSEASSNEERSRNKKDQLDEQQRRLTGNLAAIHHRWLVVSGKGGVGKSTVAANLAVALANRGKNVGLLDVDIHGPNLAKMLGMEGRQIEVSGEGIQPVRVNERLSLISMSFLLQDPNLPVIWRGPMKMKAIQQFLGDVHWGELDWLIIDSPPGTGDEPLTVAQLIPATGAVVVTTPQEVSLLDSRRAVAFARKLNLGLVGIIENMSGMSCPHCGKNIDLFKSGGGQTAAEELAVPFLGKVPITPEIVTLGDSGKSFLDSHPESDASKAFLEIVDRILSRVKA